jgi:peptidoglycan/LPS O-acetylase OafA/YrhL
MSRTSLALNNLRAFAITMVVAFHSVTAYMASQPASAPPFNSPPYIWSADPIIDSSRWFGFDLFGAFQFLYLMQLLFFLSGLFVWPGLRRKGAKLFLADRFLRLGIPFMFGAFVLMPIAYYASYRITAVDSSWSAYWSHWLALPFWQSGPMWFLWSLLALNIAATVLYRLAPRTGDVLARLAARAAANPGRLFATLVGVSALAYVPLAAVFRPWHWIDFGPFSFQPSMLPQYILYFFAGVAVGAHGVERGLLRPDGTLVRHWSWWLAGMFASFLLWIIPAGLIVKGFGATIPGLQIVSDLGLVLFEASACLGLAATFLRFAAARRPIIDSLSDNTYGIYLFHDLFAIWTQYVLLALAWPALAKGVTVFAVTLVLSWAASAALCRIPFCARLLRGQRRMSDTASAGRYSGVEVSR